MLYVSLIHICFIVIKTENNNDYCNPIVDILPLFCLQSVVYLNELYATVIQVGGSASYKTRFDPHFLHRNACTKSAIQLFTDVFNSLEVFELSVLSFA